jgi:hypothetical protein
MVSAFTYNAGSSSLFKGPGDQNPKPAYHQIRQINRESLNLGPALVRLKSTDVRFLPGQHKDGEKIVDNPIPIDVPACKFNERDPFVRGITVQNLGPRNNKLKGDVVMGWFRPLDLSPDQTKARHEIYIMVTSALCDRTGSAAECRQRITLNLHFMDTGINSVQRLSRTRGKVEDLPLQKVGEAGRYLLTLDLDGGTGDLIKFNTGAPFVGAAAAKTP